ncbi:MAG: hypothetical protein WCO26_15015, partial [Deltaproteobacteria bacterium]
FGFGSTKRKKEKNRNQPKSGHPSPPVVIPPVDLLTALYHLGQAPDEHDQRGPMDTRIFGFLGSVSMNLKTQSTVSHTTPLSTEPLPMCRVQMGASFG